MDWKIQLSLVVLISCGCWSTLVVSGAAAAAAGAEVSSQLGLYLSDEEIAQRANGNHCPKLPKLPVLPGRGWDNLRNVEMGQVMQITFTECKTTDDGRFLIPDNTFVIPVRQSTVGITSELIDHWSNSTDITSQSINLDASYSGHFASASATFSNDYQDTKQRQVDLKSVTSRVSFRTTLYVVGMEPGTRIQPKLEKMLMDALTTLQSSSQNGSDYFVAHNKSDLLLELIVRDFGTHVLNRVDAGAVLVKEDFINSNFVSSSEETRNSVRAAASFSFLQSFNFDASYRRSVDSSFLTTYDKETRASNIRSIGGDLVRPNMSVNNWIDSVAANLVPVDRAGDPLYYIITPESFPEIDLTSLSLLSSNLKAAIDRYYTKNAHVGCMDLYSANFNYDANIHDQSLCQNPSHEYTLGGIYQLCTNENTGNGNLCSQAIKQFPDTPNPSTGQHSCPVNFESVVLKRKTFKSHSHSCSGWWIFESCDDYNSAATVTTYWCAAVGKPSNTSGVMFGGLFTSKMANPVTASTTCPPTFISVPVLGDLHVCIGNDDIGFRFSVPFGGFFSCSNGNPLYTELKKVKLAAAMSMADGSYGSELQDAYAHSCPPGYAQHVADVVDSCEIFYCVKGDIHDDHGRVIVQRPPFHELNNLFTKTTSQSPTSNGSLFSSPGTWALIIGIIVIALTTVGLVYWNKRRQQRRSGYQEIPNAVFDFQDEMNAPIASGTGAAERQHIINVDVGDQQRV